MNTKPHNTDNRDGLKWTVVLACMVTFLALSFYHGYFLDKSKPIAGAGWADQGYYSNVSRKIASGDTLEKSDFHYQLGYPLLGAAFIYVGAEEPYSYVSFLLMIGSALFLFLGAKNLFSKSFVVLFLFLVFFRYGDVRKLEYASEIFMIPWNNQVVFLGVSLYFYLFSKPVSGANVRWHQLMLVSLITGWAITTREEVLIFFMPLLVLHLIMISPSWPKVIFAFLVVAAAYSPNMIFKYHVFGVLFENVRPTDEGIGYVDKLFSYLQPSRLMNNIVDVVINSSKRGLDSGGRLAILQANPWFWASPIGVDFAFSQRKQVDYCLYGYNHVNVDFLPCRREHECRKDEISLH